LRDPILVEVAQRNSTAANVRQELVHVHESEKGAALTALLQQRDLAQVLVFVNTKIGARRLARQLQRDGINADAIHGDKTQDERMKALEAFKAGSIRVLVATDVAARGLDITELPGVINYDVPFAPEDYIHRIGRTGRAGASGCAITIASGADDKAVAAIERLIKSSDRAGGAGTGQRRAPFGPRGRRIDRGAPDARTRTVPLGGTQRGPRAAGASARSAMAPDASAAPEWPPRRQSTIFSSSRMNRARRARPRRRASSSAGVERPRPWQRRAIRPSANPRAAAPCWAASRRFRPKPETAYGRAGAFAPHGRQCAAPARLGYGCACSGASVGASAGASAAASALGTLTTVTVQRACATTCVDTLPR
jgi:ATP-dependent RNA helicase RhlE